jgi:hypothetical protein
MAKKKRGKQRPFNPGALQPFAVPEIYPRVGSGSPVYRYKVVVPFEQLRPTKKPKATPQDLEELAQMLIRDFAGLATPPPSPGYGLRDPERPDDQPEMNYNANFVAYAAPIPESDRYFRALQIELQEALVEGVILIERQEVFLL